MRRLFLASAIVLVSSFLSNGAAQVGGDQRLADELESKLCSGSSGPEDIVTSDDLAVVQKARAERLSELKNLGEAGIRALRLLAKNGDPRLRSCATTYLIDLRKQEALPFLRKAALDPLYPKEYRISAIAQLGFLKDARMVKPFAGFLKEADPDLKRVSAKALGEIGNDEALAILRSALMDPQYASYSSMIARALGRAQDRSAVPLISEFAQKYNSRFEVEPYLTALAEIGTPEALSVVSKVIERSSGDKRALVFSIYGHLVGDKSESTDSKEKARIQQNIKAFCSQQKGMCP